MGHKQLTQTHREILARLRAQNVSIRTIAKILGYAPSSISRELKRNGDKKGTYLADKAQRRAQWRSRKERRVQSTKRNRCLDGKQGNMRMKENHSYPIHQLDMLEK